MIWGQEKTQTSQSKQKADICPTKFKMNKARKGDLNTVARIEGMGKWGGEKVIHQTEFPKAELT